MNSLEKKFTEEVRNDSRVFVSRFPLPNWEPMGQIGEGLDAVWVYVHPNSPDFVPSQHSTTKSKDNTDPEESRKAAEEFIARF